MDDLFYYLKIIYIAGFIISFLMSLPIAYWHYLGDDYLLCIFILVMSGPMSWINVYLAGQSLFKVLKAEIKYKIKMLILDILSDIEKARERGRNK